MIKEASAGSGGDLMRRRDVITGACAAAAWPLAARAQQAARPVVIGVLSVGPPPAHASRVKGLRAGLREQGFIEGDNLVIEFRWADGPAELRGSALELVEQNVAVLVAGGNSAARAAKAATSTIPIVFNTADDPEKLGYVSSFSHPGGNMTGVSALSGGLGAKRLEILRSVIPPATVIALLTNPTNPAEDDLRAERAVAHDIGQDVLVLEASTGAEIEQAFATLVRQKAGAILVNADAVFTAERELLVGLAAQRHLPAIYAWREFPDSGGLMSYGTGLSDAYRQMGRYVSRILKGEKPGDLPIIQPTNFELVINLKTARTLGLAIPPQLLARADEVIE
jgi:putative tryptophan/tyrosine transport system substrate-binding protein